MEIRHERNWRWNEYEGKPHENESSIVRFTLF